MIFLLSHPYTYPSIRGQSSHPAISKDCVVSFFLKLQIRVLVFFPLLYLFQFFFLHAMLVTLTVIGVFRPPFVSRHNIGRMESKGILAGDRKTGFWVINS